MNDASHSAAYESLNARRLSPQQVAMTFVPQDQFTVLTKNRHSVLLGPRGSGKTTLLTLNGMAVVSTAPVELTGTVALSADGLAMPPMLQ